MTLISNIATDLWHLYLAVIFDVYIWHLYLTFIFDIATYIWHFYLTFIYDIYIWHLYLACGSIHFPRLFSKQSWKMYWIHISRLFSKQSWKMYWIAKPLYLPLQIFWEVKMKTLFQKTAARTTASEQYWRLLTSPIVEKKHVHFPYVNSKVYWFTHGSPNPLFYRCKFSAILKWRTKNGHIL